MNKYLIRCFSFILAILFVLPFASCGTQEETVTTQTIEQEETTVLTEEQPEPEPIPTDLNPLTGLPCNESLVGKRAAGIVFNNLYVSLPQSGISKCDIIYEVLAEGGIVRMEGFVLDYQNAGTLGSMRSARPYFVDLAMAYDAIFVHAGGSERAYEAILNNSVNDVDGVKNGPFNVKGTDIFWRDQARINKGIAIEHTMFTSGENVALAVAAKKYRTTLNNPDFTAFNFKASASAIGSGKAAKYIKIPHSNSSISEFNFNAADGQYYHTQYNEPHVDVQDGKQIATPNVFIIFTEQSLYPGQSVTSYRNISTVGSGNGYYFYGGEYVNMTWKRDGINSAFKYFTADGAELSVNPGRSYVAIVDNKTASSITIS